jgi:hypothetical protein
LENVCHPVAMERGPAMIGAGPDQKLTHGPIMAGIRRHGPRCTGPGRSLRPAPLATGEPPGCGLSKAPYLDRNSDLRVPGQVRC